MPESRTRAFQRLMVGAVVRSCRLMVLNDAPSASIRISQARNTYPAGRERDWAMLLSSTRCSSLSKTSLVGMNVLMPTQLVTFTQRQASQINTQRQQQVDLSVSSTKLTDGENPPSCESTELLPRSGSMQRSLHRWNRQTLPHSYRERHSRLCYPHRQ